MESSVLVASESHCVYCFDTVLSVLERRVCPVYPVSLPGGNCSLFVTWETTPDERLRGCIGTFEAGDLKTNLGKYAKIAAFEDTRFNPISLSEVPTLICKVSFLTNFEQAASALDWVVGTHGITIQFADPASGRPL